MSTQSPVLLITGATGGIGMATARRARGAGWRLVLVTRSSGVEDLVAELGGPQVAVAAVADVGDFEGLQRAVSMATEAFGGLDAAFVNAGITAGPRTYRPDASAELDGLDGWRDMVLTNVLGTALTVRAVCDALALRGGRLVITGSVLGRYAMSGSLYSATKYAVAGIAETVRLELSGTGVGVTLIEPGPVATGFASADTTTAPKPELSSDDVARAVLFALTQPPGVDINELLLRPHGATP
jgi:NADP-dependent 3-hydroxy acid dehydrogenase YdfG